MPQLAQPQLAHHHSVGQDAAWYCEPDEFLSLACVFCFCLFFFVLLEMWIEMFFGSPSLVFSVL